MSLPDFIIDASLIPDHRRSQHQKAIDVIDAHQRTGAPFVLMLQSYVAMAPVVRSPFEVGEDLENLLADRLPQGVGFVEIQPRGDFSEMLLFNDSPKATAPEFRIHAPSLLLADDNWFEAVTWLIQRAEMVVVLIGGNSGGLIRELGALVENGRTDRTVVLYHELIANIDTMPLLDRFFRVLSLADLGPRDVLSEFVFGDLIDRLVQIRDTPETLPPVSRAGLRDAFERMAIRCRRERRGAVVRYLANAIRLALDSGDIEAALQMTSLRIDFMSSDEGAQVVARLVDALGDLLRDDPSQVLTAARLAILRVKTMTNADEAIALLESASRQCLEPLNRRALSALETSRARQMRLKRDQAGAIQAAHRALELAQQEGAGLEVARALHVIGVTWHERGDLEKARRALEQAADLMPWDPFNDDLVLVFLRLGDVMRAAGLPIAARSVFDLALKTAQAFGVTEIAAVAQERLDAANADHPEPT